MRRPAIVLIMATVTFLALLVAVGLILFSVSPTTQSNQDEIKQAIRSQHAITCAQVQNTANAYRFRSLTPSGKVEPIRHFLTRMQAQAQTLRLARGSECESAPGFLPVGIQVRRALAQINRILMSFKPKLRKPVDRRISHIDRHESFSPSYLPPSGSGLGEEGVPAILKPQLAPSVPLGPQTGHQAQPKEPATPVVPAPQESPHVENIPTAPIPTPVPKQGPALPLPKVEIEVPGLVKGKTNTVEAAISVVPIELGAGG